MSGLGKYNKLTVVRESDFGLYLHSDELGEVLMPNRYVLPEHNIGDDLDVFVYTDSEDRPVATTETPLATVGEFAYLKVIGASGVGAFMDWGLTKDLFVPFFEQKDKMEMNNYYMVGIYVDEDTDRIAASSRIHQFLESESDWITENMPVEIIPYEKTPLGYRALVEKKRIGTIYENEVFQVMELGKPMPAFIKKVRDDGKIDLMLQKGGFEKIDGTSLAILQKLKENNGFLEVTDKSSPELIAKLFNVSKKTFKKAAGQMYKRKTIEITKEGIKLVGYTLDDVKAESDAKPESVTKTENDANAESAE